MACMDEQMRESVQYGKDLPNFLTETPRKVSATKMDFRQKAGYAVGPAVRDIIVDIDSFPWVLVKRAEEHPLAEFSCTTIGNTGYVLTPTQQQDRWALVTEAGWRAWRHNPIRYYSARQELSAVLWGGSLGGTQKAAGDSDWP